jgi:hypothetical protein
LSYYNSYPTVGYPATLAILGPADSGCTAGPAVGNACIIDFVLAGGTKSGYTFQAAGTNAVGGINTQFESQAHPSTVNTTGVKGFCGTDDNVVRFVTPDAAMATRAACLALSAIGQ